MFESSQDVLFYILAICAIALTAFSCWLFYYIISIVKDIYQLTKGVKTKMDMLDDILKNLKTKINSTASYVGVAVNSIEKIVDIVGRKKMRVNQADDNKETTPKHKSKTEKKK